MSAPLNKSFVQWIIAFFVMGIIIGFAGTYITRSSESSGIERITSKNKYRYIDPLLGIDTKNSGTFGENNNLLIAIQHLIDVKTTRGAIDDAAVYMRDTNTGSWIDIKSETTFGSKLLRIPIMIAYFKEAESDPAILNQTLTFKGPASTSTNLLAVTPQEKITPGASYTVEDLIRRMIELSDGDATHLLFEHANKNTLNEIFSDLGISFKENGDTLDYIPPKLYSLFFRILYNATYLNRTYSEKALNILAHTDHGVGLSLNLPPSLMTAKRAGVRTYKDAQQISHYEMVDCTITYAPSRPYLFCALAHGTDLNALKQFFDELGKTGYDEIIASPK